MMKTLYFSPENIESRSTEMLQYLPGNERRRIDLFAPKNSALFILDMQSYFLEPSSHAFIPSAEAIVPGLQKLADAYYEKNLPVIFTQHLNTPQDAGSMSSWWRDTIRIEDPLSAIIPEFSYSNRFVLRKSQYDAFYETSLEEKLNRLNVKQVVICGLMTHLCCETTARSAFVRGFEVFFVIDGTATYNIAHHQATLLNLAHGFATPVLVAELLAELEVKAGN
jgi:isochorismate hydrolase